jgi:hypothetical protein
MRFLRTWQSILLHAVGIGASATDVPAQEQDAKTGQRRRGDFRTPDRLKAGDLAPDFTLQSLDRPENDDQTGEAYSAWLNRTDIVGEGSRIASLGGQGPRDFKPDAAAAALARHLSDAVAAP